jgi:tetratricopeptide (TPR) repeat protein
MHAMIAPSELILDTNPGAMNAQIEAACRLHDTAVAAYDTGQADEVETLFRQALALFERTEGVDHPDVAAVLGNLGAVYKERCDYAAAARCYERAVTIVEAFLDTGDDELAQLRLHAWRNWGRLLRRQGQYSQAAAVIRRALTFAEQRFGAESLETAWTLNDLGMLGKYAGWFDAAAQCYHRALALVEQHCGGSIR